MARAPFFYRTAILGVGLLGGSLALALRHRGLTAQVVGYGRKERNLKAALQKGIIDSYCLFAEEAVQGADLVVLATPVGAFLPLAKAIKGHLKGGSVQMDVGSIKGSLARRLHTLLPSYVPCHPIAGGERSGVEAAHEGLFNGALCIITPFEDTNTPALRGIRALWKALGCRVRHMSPKEHDRVYALVSHLPHLVSYALVGTAREADSRSLPYAGRGFRDSTRIALSSPELWSDICTMNRGNLLRLLRLFKKQLAELQDCLQRADQEALMKTMEKARRFRARLEG